MKQMAFNCMLIIIWAIHGCIVFIWLFWSWYTVYEHVPIEDPFLFCLYEPVISTVNLKSLQDLRIFRLSDFSQPIDFLHVSPTKRFAVPLLMCINCHLSLQTVRLMDWFNDLWACLIAIDMECSALVAKHLLKYSTIPLNNSGSDSCTPGEGHSNSAQ